MPMQTNAQVAARLAFTGLKGGYQERAGKTLLAALIEVGKNMEAFFPDATHTTDKNNMFGTFDTLVTQIHTAVAKLNN